MAIPYLQDIKHQKLGTSVYLGIPYSFLAVYVICHRGNDSQLAVPLLKKMLPQDCKLKDIIGGLNAWSDNVDQTFPKY